MRFGYLHPGTLLGEWGCSYKQGLAVTNTGSNCKLVNKGSRRRRRVDPALATVLSGLDDISSLEDRKELRTKGCSLLETGFSKRQVKHQGGDTHPVSPPCTNRKSYTFITKRLHWLWRNLIGWNDRTQPPFTFWFFFLLVCMFEGVFPFQTFPQASLPNGYVKQVPCICETGVSCHHFVKWLNPISLFSLHLKQTETSSHSNTRSPC